MGPWFDRRGRLSSLPGFLSQYRLLAALSILWFLVQTYRFVFPPLFATFQDVYGVSSAATGVIFSVLLTAYAAMQFPAGGLADRYGERRVITAGAAVAVVAVSLAAIAPSYQVLLAAALLIGLGTGVHKTVAIPLLSRTYPGHRGRTIGAMDTVGIGGGIVAPLLVTAALAVGEWRLAFVALGLTGAFVTLAFARRRERSRAGPDPSASGDAAGDTHGSLRRYLAAFADPRLALFAPVAVVYSFVYNGMVAFFPAYLVAKGLPIGSANLLFGVLFAGTVTQAVTGELSDRLGRVPLALGLLGCMLLGLVFLVELTAPAALLGVALLLGLGVHGFRPVRDSYLSDLIPEAVRGGTLGLVRTVMLGAGALAPALVGLGIDTVGYRPAFVGLAVVQVVAVLLATTQLFLSGRYSRL